MPLRPWMKFALATLGTIDVLLGVAMIGFYHEGCKLLGVPKPHPLWTLQLAGAVALLLGIGYWLVSRNPVRWRGVLIVGFLIHVAASVWIVRAVSLDKLRFEFLAVVVLTALVYLVPLAIIIRRLFQLGPAVYDRPLRPESTAATATRSELVRHSIWALMLIATVLPSSWAVAHAVGDINTRRELRNRPARWTPLAVNLPKSVGEEFPYATIDAYPHLRFVDPTYVTEIPDGSGRMIVLQRSGLVKAFSKLLPSPLSGRGAGGEGRTSFDDPSPSPRPSPVKGEGDFASQSDETPAVFLDLTDRALTVPEKAEDGLLCLAFHPEYANAKSPHHGEVFVRYTSMDGGQRSNRLSRLTLAADGRTVDPASEEILIEMPEKSVVHKGGALAFGPDGFLYTTFGTDGRHFPHEHAQRIDHGLFAGVLRIDPDCRGGEVSHAPPRSPALGKTAGYFIPNDNPFVGQPGVLEEFYSLGLRNPWRLSIDKQTGLIWIGDVGDRHREEINIATPGSNHQFDYLEGTLPTRDYQPLAPQKPAKIIGHEAPPLYEYERDGINRCVIGGYVYRGRRFSELTGKYVYGDQCGRIYAITVDDENKFVRNELIAVVRTTGLGVSSLGEDAEGELYVCWIGDTGIGGGRVFRFERGSQRPEQKLPPVLSATGLFTDMKSLQPHPALVDYEINSPLWSDRATKRRWIGLVSTEKIRGELNGKWQFPPGTVFVKHFELPLDESRVQGSGFRSPQATRWGEVQESTVSGRANGPPAQESGGSSFSPGPQAGPSRRLETRVIVRDDRGGVYGATYRWNAEETEAYLIDFSTTEEIEYIDASGEKQTQTWLFPGRFDCLTCHNQNADGVLGFTARQLNREVRSHGLSENQLVKFAQAGMFEFDCRPEDTERVITLTPLDDRAASVEQRVRSYLDSNCSHCHQPGGRFGPWDARIATPLGQQGIIDGVAVTHRGENPRSRVVRPADLDFSFLYVRLASNDRFMRMPPLARTVVHDDAVELLAEWIRSHPRLPEDANQAKPKNTTPAADEGNEYIGSSATEAKRR